MGCHTICSPLDSLKHCVPTMSGHWEATRLDSSLLATSEGSFVTFTFLSHLFHIEQHI